MTDLARALERLIPGIRAQFPQLEGLPDGRPRLYLDNAAGTLLPLSVAEAMRDAALSLNPQPGRDWPSAVRTRQAHQEARALLGEFLNAGRGDRIYFTESTTASLFGLRAALEPRWDTRAALVVTDADHFANISPWEWRSASEGRSRWEVRRVRVDAEGQLVSASLGAALDGRVRLVALPLAGNGLGTIIPAANVIREVRRNSPDAVVVVDAVHGAPHLPIDVRALGADALAFSTYKLFGPGAGVLWISERLAPRLDPYHVEPHTDPETLMEWGTRNNATAGGVRAALEYLRRLGERLEPAAIGCHPEYPRTRRHFKLAMDAIRAHEACLSQRVLRGLADLAAVRIHGVSDPDRTQERVPTFAFSIRGKSDVEVERALWEKAGIQVAAGNHYSAAIVRGLGLSGVVRASFAHYNSVEDADRLLAGVRALASPG